jgi:alkanesulfonate monooxygenase SsuD/methylene tetrahydromethanopterin reductase-like flavin-dependent oxidoreductase (luciferase family)
MPDGPWHASIPVLAAAAEVTARIRLGTLVSTPNFRHPVTLARDALALDDLTAGRFDLGVGPGSAGPDASALGQSPWTNGERMERFAEFLQILRPILDGGSTTKTTVQGHHYAAIDAPSTPGALQSPFPLTVAAAGVVGLRLAAAHGQQWVTIGPGGPGERTPETILRAVSKQCELLQAACADMGRGPATLAKVVLWTPAEPVISSVDQFEALIAPYVQLGFDQFVVHHPEQTGPYGGSRSIFEQFAGRTY